ncbi:HWE histidine kinase domain-containing protein [Sulfitobacter sp. S190]|uniref:HWE histidine kinase domain-containing protein n=1 Tax=Sulfitobacter sp. S190 TaxID=2867022 RepID=UPI0021A70AB5|nr:HWE histidine kinase domain-containing protein [Sulfitobacter sp. S190]UWR23315.1 GAF domain-containing protein [Sulfitobacter sp. S190]
MDNTATQLHGDLSLDTCDLEPIHTPGRIQPFGALLAGPSDLSKIEYCSANVAEYLGIEPQVLLGSAFSKAIGEQITHDLRNLASISTARTQRERLGRYTLDAGDFEIYLHVNPQNQSVVEFERAPTETPSHRKAPIDEMRKYLASAGSRDSIEKMLDACVVGLGALTGYDRVLAYRYAENGDGEVVAEMRSGAATSFLGLRYPAWDVPEQARALQIKNPLRMLTDVAQDPVPVLAYDKKLPPLDMSLAHLRGISPIHVEYLSNMGVGATLTIGLVVDGRLWGMFACHHLSPRVIGSDVRIAVELFGQMVSLLIKQRMDISETRRRHKAAEARERILAETDANTDFLHSFQSLAPILAEVIECDGLAVTYEGKTLIHGSAPSHDAIAGISRYDDTQEDVILGIENLTQSDLVNGAELGASAGALLIRATAAYPMQLMFFRDEKIRSLNWAGKPEKKLDAGPLGPRITPRGSFDAYVESQRGFGNPWTASELAAAREIQILLTQIAAKGERVQLMRHQDLVTHQRQQDLMIAELNHRVKNILALIRSLSRQAKSSSASLESYALALEQRISALAAAHDLAVSNSMNGVSLRSVLETELQPFLTDDASQVLLTGPKIGLRADVAPIIALVMHEIVSNAVKYGALSTPDGIVRVQWSVSDDMLKLSWKELGGPPVEEPTRHGFGRSLVEKAITYEFDGHAVLSFAPGGVTFSFELPGENLVDLEAETEVKLVGSVGVIEMAASDKSALLVEDNVVLAMDMVETLTHLGTSNVETASTVEAGMKLAKKGGFDFAVLDMNLRGVVSFSIAEHLIEAGVPFIFVTGYGSSIELPETLRQVPILTKPVDEGTLSRCIEKLLQ